MERGMKRDVGELWAMRMPPARAIERISFKGGEEEGGIRRARHLE